MKIFHVADLHFGKHVYMGDTGKDQAFWIKGFLEACEKERPEAVVIAGDVYDTAAPGDGAYELFDQLIGGLGKLDIYVAVIAGNHDSGTKLACCSSVLSEQKIHIVGTQNGSEVEHFTFDPGDGYGPVTFWMLPYLERSDVEAALGVEKVDNLEAGIRMLLQTQKLNSKERNVLLSHQTVGTPKEDIKWGGSEKQIGGVRKIDFSVYDGFTYVALGHIHSTYPVGRPGIRYAGTPLCYDFRETSQGHKGYLEVILAGPEDEPAVKQVEVPPLHRMLEPFVGTKEEMDKMIRAYSGGPGEGREDYVMIYLKENDFSTAQEDYYRNLLLQKHSILLQTDYDFEKMYGIEISEDAAKDAGNGEEEDRSPRKKFIELYKMRRGSAPSDDELELIEHIGELVGRGNYSGNEKAMKEQQEKDVQSLIKKAGTLKAKQGRDEE